MGKSKWPDGKTSSDWMDVAGLLMEVGEASNAAITITIEPCGTRETPDFVLKATAAPMGLDSAGPALSVSTSCRARGSGMANLKGLFFFLLYQLDFVAVTQSDIDNSPA